VAGDLAWLPEPPRDDKAPKEDKTAPKTKDDKELPRVQGVVALHLDAVRSFLTQAIEGRTGARVLIAPILPTSIAHALAGLGIAPCLVDEAGLQALQGQRSVTLPAPAQWVDALPITTAKGKGTLTLQAVGVERSWLGAGTPRTAPPAAGKRGG
jgi:hypothetical protein